MAEQTEKMDQLFGKLKALGERAKQARSSFGSPIADRLLDRVTKISAKLPPNNGHAQTQTQTQQQEATISCPKCFKQLAQGVRFCENCGFDFQEESRKQMRALVERENLERAGKMGVISGG